jgi:hypothetical protein
MRRRVLRFRALRAVANFNRRVVECFTCGSRNLKRLELHHRRYAKGSVLASHGGERSQEALKYPQRFELLCRECHDTVHANTEEKWDMRGTRRLLIVIPIVLLDRTGRR